MIDAIRAKIEQAGDELNAKDAPSSVDASSCESGDAAQIVRGSTCTSKEARSRSNAKANSSSRSRASRRRTFWLNSHGAPIIADAAEPTAISVPPPRTHALTVSA